MRLCDQERNQCQRGFTWAFRVQWPVFGDFECNGLVRPVATGLPSPTQYLNANSGSEDNALITMKSSAPSSPVQFKPGREKMQRMENIAIPESEPSPSSLSS
jgi:hypothetical protein